MLNEFLLKACEGIAIEKLSEAIEMFLKNNSLQIELFAWECKENFLVLKINIWFDRATGVVTDIKLDDETNQVEYFPKEYSIFETVNNNFLLCIDPSRESRRLSSFEHYYGQILSLSSEEPRSISLIFELNEKFNIDNSYLKIKANKKYIKFNIKELTEEVPKIKDVAIKYGFIPQLFED